MAGPLPELHRVWWSIDLPGYRPHPKPYATYSPFDYDALPPIGRTLDDDLAWLLAERPVRGSLADDKGADPERAPTLDELAALWPTGCERTPAAFRAFLGSPEPARRVRSATACYLDLGQFPFRSPAVGRSCTSSPSSSRCSPGGSSWATRARRRSW